MGPVYQPNSIPTSQNWFPTSITGKLVIIEGHIPRVVILSAALLHFHVNLEVSRGVDHGPNSFHCSMRRIMAAAHGAYPVQPSPGPWWTWQERLLKCAGFQGFLKSA